MRNVNDWKPTKFKRRPDGSLGPADDPKIVGIRSRLVVGCMGPFYERALLAHARGSLLDLGCGTVPLFGVYRDCITHATCIDWPSSEHARLHVDAAADLNRLFPLKAGAFDTILVTDVLEHLAEPSAFFGECARVLAPGGTLILGVPFLYWLHETPHDYLRHTEFSLRRLCQAAGLRVLSLEQYGGPLAVVLDMVGKQIQHEASAWLFQWTAMRILRSRLGTALDVRKRQLFPLGYCLVASLD